MVSLPIEVGVFTGHTHMDRIAFAGRNTHGFGGISTVETTHTG